MRMGMRIQCWRGWDGEAKKMRRKKKRNLLDERMLGNGSVGRRSDTGGKHRLGNGLLRMSLLLLLLRMRMRMMRLVTAAVALAVAVTVTIPLTISLTLTITITLAVTILEGVRARLARVF